MSTGSVIAGVEASVHLAPRSDEDPAPYAGPDSSLFVWLRITLEDGRVGHGFTGRFLAAEVVHFLNGTVREALRQRDPLADPCVLKALICRHNPRGMTGVFVSALSALDIALSDLKAQESGMNVADLLGGARYEAPAYVTCGFPGLEMDALVATVASEIAAGACGVKVLVGKKGRTTAEDAERVRQVRDAIGPDADLIVDANCAYDLGTAAELARRIADCRPAWFEEPVKGNDMRDLSALSAQGVVPIGAGQMEQSQERFRALAEEAGVAVVQPNVVFAGGFDAACSVAETAQKAGCAVSPAGGWDFLNLLFVCGALSDGAVEVHRGQDPIVRTVLGAPLSLADGRLSVPREPGLGFDIDQRSLAATTVSGP